MRAIPNKRVGRWVLLLGLAGAFGCKRPSDIERPLDATFAGCAGVLEGASVRCELGAEGRVRVFVPSGAEPSFVARGIVVTPTATNDVEGGRLYRLALAGDAGELVVRRVDETGVVRAFRLLFEPSGRPWVEEAKELRRAGKLAEARALAEQHLESGTVHDSALAAGLLARIALSEGRVDEAISGLRDAMARDEVAGRLSDRVDDGLALAFTLHQRRRRYVDAEAVLDELEPLLTRYPEGWARAPLYRGQLAMDTGRARLAFRSLQDAEARAKRLGLARLDRTARNLRAANPQLLGHLEDGLRQLRTLDAELDSGDDVTPCERAEVALNTSSAALRLSEVRAWRGRGEPAEDGREPSQRALAFFEKGCPDPKIRAVALGNLAWAAQQGGHGSEALARIAEARKADAHPRIREQLLWLEVEARALLAMGRARDALAPLEHLGELASASGLPDCRWRAALARGEVSEALGRDDDALASYLEAETVLDDASASVPLEDGRAAFLAYADASSSRALALLLRRGRAAEALALLRAARSRALATLALSLQASSLDAATHATWDAALVDYWQQRGQIEQGAQDEWEKSAVRVAELRAEHEATERALRKHLDDTIATRLPLVAARRRAWAPSGPEEGELILAYATTRTGEVGFAAMGPSVIAFAIPRADSGVPSADALLGPAKAMLRTARRVRVLAHGPLRAIDFASLSLDGERLGARVAVVYGLDVPARAPAKPQQGALVVGDPAENLPAAAIEARDVGALLRARGEQVTSLGGERATASTILGALPLAAIFHYAGHAVFAGREGLESRLVLGGGGHVSLSDVLALTAAPSLVFLSSCDAGREDATVANESLGFAQAFVVAGARAVVAPVRVVDDVVAGRVAARFYASEGEPADALRAAQLAVGNDDAFAFRLFVP